jgi:hypothetical protein
MINDTALSLNAIRNRNGQPLYQDLLDIANNFCITNAKSLSFVERLKCFRLSRTGTKRRHSDYDGIDSTRRQLERVEVLTEEPSDAYIAVSYPWSASEKEEDRIGGYQLTTSKCPVEVRDVVLDRIINFAEYVASIQAGEHIDMPFWIDTLSIDQKNLQEKDHAMQSMDLVYKNCTVALGYLWVKIEHQHELDLLVMLLRGRVSIDRAPRKYPELRKTVDAESVANILALILKIVADPWWSRAWIFQEDYLSGRRMQLMIRHSTGLSKSHAVKELGNLPGEILISSADFRQHATLFALAYRRQPQLNENQIMLCEEILRKAGKYTVLHKYERGGNEKRIMKAMSSTIFRDLGTRSITEPSDLLAISANCMDYSVRLDTKKVQESESSLSLCILALYMLNGDVIKNGAKETESLSGNILDFLDAQSMTFHASFTRGQLTFFKHCRFSVNRFTEDGLETEGMLWEVSAELPAMGPAASYANKKGSYSERDLYRDGLNRYQRCRLWKLVFHLRALRHHALADDLDEYLMEEDLEPYSGDEWPLRHCMDIMAIQVIAAMDKGLPLLLGRLIDAEHRESEAPYRAIFVRDYAVIREDDKALVFTSWTGTQESCDDEFAQRRPAKYVSLVVDRNGKTSRGVPKLLNKRWVNGLCFFKGEQTGRVLFPWPACLSKKAG